MVSVLRSKRCPSCSTTIELVVSDEQFDEMQDPGGRVFQAILPDIEPAIIERFITGYCPPCWDAVFGLEEQE